MAVIMSKQLVVPEGPVKGVAGSDLEIGSSVWLKINGTLKEFLIVHQGLPSSMYDSSCEGVWLLMKDCYENRVRGKDSHDYENSGIHIYLNGTFLNLFDANIKAQIKQIKLPYRAGTNGSSTTITSGANGLSAQIFLLGGYEVGFTQSTSSSFPIDGACLDYFSGASNSTRIAYLNGAATSWWLRSPFINISNVGVWCVNTDGSHASSFPNTDSFGIRPALILPSNALFDPGTGEFLGVA